MKIHISLVGGQAEPVYNGILYADADRNYLICSGQSIEIAERIKNEVFACIIIPFNPTDLLVINKQIEELIGTLSADDEISLNLVGGTKFWALAFYSYFANNDKAQIFLVDQNHKVSDFKTHKVQSVEFNMDVLFKLNGNQLKHYTPFDTYTNEDKSVAESILRSRQFCFPSFNKLTATLSDEWNKNIQTKKEGRLELSENNYIEWKKPSYAKLVMSNKKQIVKEFLLQSPNAVHLVFNSGWFEYKIALMLSHWRYGKDIRTNCIFPLSESDDTQRPKNEIDIVVNTGHKILFVECKTKITKSTDIDKFRTAVKNYGGMGSKALFVTDIEMNELQKEKCRESEIMIFSLDAAGPNKEQELFKLLEAELFNINTK